MNDMELDEILDQWKAPAVRTAWRNETRAGLAAGRRWWPSWLVASATKGLFAGVFAGAVMFVLLTFQAFPQSVGLFSGYRIPYLVESELVRYADDGRPKVKIRYTSFMHGGDVIIADMAISGSNAWGNFVQGIGSSVRMFVLQIAPTVMIPSQSAESVAWHRALVNNRCARNSSDVISHETILGHSTTVVQTSSPGQMRTTQWLAPDLGCFTLKQINDLPRPDGTFRVLLRLQALKITVNH